MTTNDPISDMLTRIRNAAAVKKTEVELPFSKVKLRLAEILKSQGYIGDARRISGSTGVKSVKDSRFDSIIIGLKYNKGKSVITSIKRLSKPGRRVYCKKNDLPIVLNSYGIAIVSTSKGIMTNKEAHKSGIGGELICEIY